VRVALNVGQRAFGNRRPAETASRFPDESDNGPIGERGGTRTLDPMIKSHVLYRLSYALTCRAV
jgi:hypothetical protein